MIARGRQGVPQKPGSGTLSTPSRPHTPPGRSAESHNGPSRSTNPDRAATIRILEGTADVVQELSPVVTPQVIIGMADLARGVYVNPMLADYIARIVEATRAATQVRMGVSVRGARALIKASKTWAIAHGRTYVTPDDVKALAEVVLSHRLVLDPEAEFDGVTAQAVIGQVILDIVPPARNELG